MRKRVLVTRAAEDAPGLAHALDRLGFEPVLVPLLERVWHLQPVIEAAEHYPDVDVVLVTSGVTAEVLATAAPTAWRTARWAAVGPSTQRRLEELGLPCHVVPPRATADDLIDTLGDVRGLRVVYPRADLAGPRSRERLAELGAELVDVVAYTNRAPHGCAERLRQSLPVDATPLLSGSAARRVATAITPGTEGSLGQVIAIGPSTAAVAREAGLPVHLVAAPHTLAGVLRMLARALGQPIS